MITGILKEDIATTVAEKAKSEGIPETSLVERWVKLGKLAEEHPDMLSGDLIAYLNNGEYPSTSAEDAPLSQGKDAEYEAENVRMMMKMLVYALNRHSPNHSCVGKATSLMKRLGMYKLTDILR
ncbi:TPA: hypothetical protein UL576_004091 [Klebsiella pneumoniae]|uniref:hypothetical protein n=1 Tax=Klebsiella/Raoultella group TaxID=2890311 RepID=UPI000D1AF96F|nr:hypothetical protein [Klebsiella pneumoniae]EIY9028028.1 hypothetical protein [Salmonella enterica]EKV8501003.1 hypothetical protein [Escherichia coli]HCW0178922.1 hypothetical protein [Citrobacter freundii]HDU3837873.1 hypothetical protein [Klebsiella pneumoniae subsp. pneumoniae]MBG1882687.1 hypothetical protein [Klebsiella pneumoniae]